MGYHRMRFESREVPKPVGVVKKMGCLTGSSAHHGQARNDAVQHAASGGGLVLALVET